MRITGYSFGSITVDGKAYQSDLIIYPGHVEPSWWRKDGHRLRPEDLKEVMESRPDVLVIGTGAYGAMRVPEETARYVESAGVELHAARTAKAVEIYNALPPGRQAVAALHLTC